jgi:hypothetical protein
MGCSELMRNEWLGNGDAMAVDRFWMSNRLCYGWLGDGLFGVDGRRMAWRWATDGYRYATAMNVNG